MERKKIRLGISSCLLGEPVRYDGLHRRNSYIVDILSKIFEFVSICPEMAIGMGVPRPPIQLVAWGQNDIRAVGVKNRELNVTEALMEFGRVTAGKLNKVRGYILKSKSPSCGKQVKIHNRDGKLLGYEAGLFARVLMETLPLLPVEEEKPLDEMCLRKNFLDRVFAYDRLLSLVEEGMTIAKLVKFHTENRLLVHSKSQDAYGRLEELISDAQGQPLAGLMQTYSTEFMNALNYPSTLAE